MNRLKHHNKFSTALRETRWERGLSTVELAKKVGVSSSFLSEIEMERRRCPWDRADAIFSALKLNGEEKLYMISLLVKENRDVSDDILEILGCDMVARLITLKYCKDNKENKKVEKDSIVFNFESRMNEIIK